MSIQPKVYRSKGADFVPKEMLRSPVIDLTIEPGKTTVEPAPNSNTRSGRCQGEAKQPPRVGQAKGSESGAESQGHREAKGEGEGFGEAQGEGYGETEGEGYGEAQGEGVGQTKGESQGCYEEDWLRAVLCDVFFFFEQMTIILTQSYKREK